MGGSIVGSLLRFDSKKRELFHPNAPAYPVFDQKVGLCISESINSAGVHHVRVQWLKPVYHFGSLTSVSDFQLDNFIVLGSVGEKK